MSLYYILYFLAIFTISSYHLRQLVPTVVKALTSLLNFISFPTRPGQRFEDHENIARYQIFPRARKRSGIATCFARKYSETFFPNASYIEVAETPRSKWSFSRKCTARENYLLAVPYACIFHERESQLTVNMWQLEPLYTLPIVTVL